MCTGEFLGNLTNCQGVTCHGLASRPGGVEIHLAFMLQKPGLAPAAMSHSAPRLHFVAKCEKISTDSTGAGKRVAGAKHSKALACFNCGRTCNWCQAY